MTEAGELPELVPTPPGPALTGARVWDDAERPARPKPAFISEYSARGRPAARSLKMIHDQLRRELETIRELVEQVARGDLEAHEAQLGLNQMSMRQNNWTLGAYCASYCGLVAAPRR